MNFEVNRQVALFLIILTCVAVSSAYSFQEGKQKGYEAGFQKGMSEQIDLNEACGPYMTTCTYNDNLSEAIGLKPNLTNPSCASQNREGLKC